jgi:hypothetical protein
MTKWSGSLTAAATGGAGRMDTTVIDRRMSALARTREMVVIIRDRSSICGGTVASDTTAAFRVGSMSRKR